MTLTRMLRRLLRQTAGQDVLEYALLTASIAILAAAGVGAVGQSLDGLFTRVASDVVAQGGPALSGGSPGGGGGGTTPGGGTPPGNGNGNGGTGGGNGGSGGRGGGS